MSERITVAEAAEILGKSERNVTRLITEKNLSAEHDTNTRGTLKYWLKRDDVLKFKADSQEDRQPAKTFKAQTQHFERIVPDTEKEGIQPDSKADSQTADGSETVLALKNHIDSLERRLLAQDKQLEAWDTAFRNFKGTLLTLNQQPGNLIESHVGLGPGAGESRRKQILSWILAALLLAFIIQFFFQ